MTNSKGWGVTFALFVWRCIFIIMLMLVGYAIATVEFRKTNTQCQEQLSICKDILNDPHHCVSIVVEALKGE